MDDPYRAPEVPADVPASDLPLTDPRVSRGARSPAFWIPIVIAVAIAFGLGLNFYHHHSNVIPDARADAGAATHFTPTLR
jgi:hypothetical protein